MSNDLFLILPELIILLSACALMVIEAIKPKHVSIYTFLVTIVSLLTASLVVLTHMPEASQLILHDALQIDRLSAVLKVFILLISVVVFFYSRTYLQLRDIDKSEYYMLGLFAILGMMVMTSSASMLSLYMGLELMSLSLYAMVAFMRDSSVSLEAAMKYFVLGAIASGMLLYGMSFIYGVTGSLNLAVIAEHLDAGGSILVVFATMFIIAGLAFKLGVVPFHMWLPDVYQGAPTAVTLFISAAPKLAAFAMVMRLLVEGLGD